MALSLQQQEDALRSEQQALREEHKNLTEQLRQLYQDVEFDQKKLATTKTLFHANVKRALDEAAMRGARDHIYLPYIHDLIVHVLGKLLREATMVDPDKVIHDIIQLEQDMKEDERDEQGKTTIEGESMIAAQWELSKRAAVQSIEDMLSTCKSWGEDHNNHASKLESEARRAASEESAGSEGASDTALKLAQQLQSSPDEDDSDKDDSDKDDSDEGEGAAGPSRVRNDDDDDDDESDEEQEEPPEMPFTYL